MCSHYRCADRFCRHFGPGEARAMASSGSPGDLEFPVPRRYLGDYLCYNRAIMPKQQIMRILGAAIVLIVLSFAPSVARAHIGHQHQASVHGGHGQVASQVASHESERPATPASLQQAQWGQAETLAGFGPQLRRRLLLVRMRRLLRGRVAQPCGVRPVSPVDNAGCVCAVTDMAGPRARVAQAPSKTLHLNPTEQ